MILQLLHSTPAPIDRQQVNCLSREEGYLACDDSHDHGLGWAHKHMMQPHGSEQAVSARQAGIGMHQEGCALHEGPQVNVHVPLIISQIPVYAIQPQSAPWRECASLYMLMFDCVCTYCIPVFFNAQKCTAQKSSRLLQTVMQVQHTYAAPC